LELLYLSFWHEIC